MDIEKQLEMIIKKYNMQIDINGVLRDEIKIFLQKAIKSDEKVGIMCAGRHTEHFLKDFKDIVRPCCILDNSSQKIGTVLEKIPIYSIEYCKNLDKIIISTIDYRDEVKDQLEKNGFSRDKMVDIYELLSQNGLVSSQTYYSIQDNVYVPFIFLNNRYKFSTQKSYYLYMLIKCYLSIRDIKTALEYMEEYIGNGFEKKEKVKAVYDEVNQLIVKIKNICAQRQKRDIIWFWQDALCFEWVDFMPFYQEQREKSLFFTNTYNSSVWTRCVYELIFNKRYEIDDKAYLGRASRKYDWVEKLKKEGYICARVASTQDNKVELIEETDLKKEKLLSFDQATSQLYWTLMNYIINSGKPVFILAHSVIEAHQPICSPDLLEYSGEWSGFDKRFQTEYREKLLRNVQITCKYLDKITRYTCELVGEGNVKIFMSDHGSAWDKKSRRWNKDANHFNFIVSGDGIEKRKCHGLFSLYQFDKVIDYIINPDDNNLDRIFQKEIILQSTDVYNKNIIKLFIEIGLEEYCISFRGIQTERDRYILLKTGDEIYNIFPDDYTNYIDKPECQERIEECRKKAGTVFIGEEEEKFKDTVILYDFLKSRKGLINQEQEFT